jgi:hypothetical protein
MSSKGYHPKKHRERKGGIRYTCSHLKKKNKTYIKMPT